VQVCRDPNDDFLLALCKDGKANFLLSGDKDLLVIDVFETTQIVSLSDFEKLISN
jgi:predicted nucleic acid-binding protein